MKRIVTGILAHVDGGKTTLSEALLYLSGRIKRLGRVDHRDSYFDTFEQERKRGITIFSKRGELSFPDFSMTLVDTPGHWDFVAETERTLSILDYAILVINGREGVQSHTRTLVDLLEKYCVPYFVFVNKMDLEGTSKVSIMRELKKSLDEKCVDFTSDYENSTFTEEELEEIAITDERMMDEFLESGSISCETLVRCIKERKIIPCYFGSALKLQGVNQLIYGLSKYTCEPEYGSSFSAIVYKISYDKKGNRLTHMRITGGVLKVKDSVSTGFSDEKINEIRIYSGETYDSTDECQCGSVCAVTGLKNTFAGQNIGKNGIERNYICQPVMKYEIVSEDIENSGELFKKIRSLGDELPEINMEFDKGLGIISVQLMGKIQLEVIKQIIEDRFDINVEFRHGNVIYKEKPEKISWGIGHFEPLRHYAEVLLRIEPALTGEGIIVKRDKNVNLSLADTVESHLKEKIHRGVLTGAPITDTIITILFAGGHVKHTEGGDFREASYRAFRNALANNKCILLEPWYDFNVEVPENHIGKVMNDIRNMGGEFGQPYIESGKGSISGSAPVSEMSDYGEKLAVATSGVGQIVLKGGGYRPCRHQDEVVNKTCYDFQTDIENSADSVFCLKGSGFNVPWYQVADYASQECRDILKKEKKKNTKMQSADTVANCKTYKKGIESQKNNHVSDEELEKIFERTYGPKKERIHVLQQNKRPDIDRIAIEKTFIRDEYLIADGYNLIFAWDKLRKISEKNMDSARDALLDILSNYQGFTGSRVVAVFDAYRVKGGKRRNEKFGEVEVIFTAEGETADSYIEKLTRDVAKEYYVRVATSDNLEQMIITGNGAHRMSADEFIETVENIDGVISELIEKYNREAYLNSRVTIGEKIGKLGKGGMEK